MTEAHEPTLRLLGFPAVRTGASAGTFPTRGYGLFAMLATSPGLAMSRAQAAAQLWENGDTKANFVNLRQLIMRMTKTLPSLPSILAIDEKTLRIIAPWEIDVCRFLDLADLATIEGARALIELYRGDLLQGIDLPTLPREDPFATSRTYLRERFFGFVATAVKELTSYGHADVALLRLLERHAFSIDGSREETYRALISAYGAIGCDEDSRRLFGLLTETLRRDGSPAPDSDTRSSLARATTRSVDMRALPMVDARKSGVILPRVGLLAPNWVSLGSPRNFLRAFVEDIANELARYSSLMTLAAHSSFLATNDGGALFDNSALRTDYTVTSVVRPGDGPGALTVRLVNSRTNSIVWADEYPLGEELIIRSGRVMIARIASALSKAIENDQLGSLNRTSDGSAYVSFLAGQDALKTSDLRHMRRARKCYREALSHDRCFADAYSGLSCSLYVEWLLLGGNDPKLLFEAGELASLAIAHDPNNSSGYWRKAMVSLYQHRFDDSEECFTRAQELHPNSADILLDHSDALGHVGDANLAWSKFERAIDLNPTPPDHYWWAGASIAFSQGEYEKAIGLCGRLASEESVLRLLAASHGQLGNKDEARHYGQLLAESYPGETAENMARLQPHRSKSDLQPFIDGLRIAGVR